MSPPPVSGPKWPSYENSPWKVGDVIQFTVGEPTDPDYECYRCLLLAFVDPRWGADGWEWIFESIVLSLEDAKGLTEINKKQKLWVSEHGGFTLVSRLDT